jgi:hypothetical protein
MHCTLPLHAHGESFRAVAAKVIVKPLPPVPATEPVSATPTKTVSVPAKKPAKASLKGVIMKKKSKSAPEAKSPPDSAKANKASDGTSPDPKRRKVAVES